MEKELDVTKLKYVLYARRSTTDETRQIRSIPDQIHDCLAMAKRIHINVDVNILKESKSAKLPNKRPVFNQMIKDIRRGKYDGILAWNPDRLARNMLEGGQLIDMVDQEILKDLKFVTHHFTSDANGKMLLGMAFVLSKQYSDKLGQDVTRGVRSMHARGKSPAPKHGYFRDDDGLYKPDPRTHQMIVEAWSRLANGDSQASIKDYLSANNYYRTTKESKRNKKPSRKISMSKQMLSSMFKDLFYYGVLVQAGKSIDLRDVYDFEPAVSESVFNKIQYVSHRQKMPYKSRGVFLPLKNMVFCGYCEYQMYAGTSQSGSGAGTRYLNYSCRNNNCYVNSPENKAKPRNDKTKIPTSVRAKVVLDFIYELLKDGLKFTKSEYENYLKGLTHVSEKEQQKITIEILSLEGQKKHLIAEKRRLGIALPKIEEGTELYKINAEEYEQVLHDYGVIQSGIVKLKNEINDPEHDSLTWKQFFKLSKNAGKSVQAGSPVQKDAICRFVFTNLALVTKSRAGVSKIEV